MTKRNANIESKSNGAEEFLPHFLENFPESGFDEIEGSGLVDAWNLAGSALRNEPVDEELKSSVKAYIFDAIAKQDLESRRLDRNLLRRPWSGLRLVTTRFSAVAASLLVLVGMSFVFAPDIHTIRAPYGSVEAVGFVLPDGTTGYLSAGSELRYSYTYGSASRVVALKGEALFEVIKNGSPFYVDTYNTRVAVLGTSFSVRAWASDVDPSTIVKVRDGKVAVSRRYNTSQRVFLERAQQINVRPKVVILRESIEPASKHAFNWLSGGIDFVNMPIGSVLNELSRRFDIRLDASISILDRRITLLPSEKASLEDVLVDISAALNIGYRKIAGGYEFYTVPFSAF